MNERGPGPHNARRFPPPWSRNSPALTTTVRRLLQAGQPSSSTARAKGAIGRLDFHFTLVLRARGEPECAARGLNNSAAGAFVWIVHKLVEPNLRRRSNTKVALVMKLQAGLARASGFNRFVGVNTAAS